MDLSGRRPGIVVGVLLTVLIPLFLFVGFSDAFFVKKEEQKGIDVRVEAQRALVLLGEAPLDTLDMQDLSFLARNLQHAEEETRAAIVAELALRFRDISYPKEHIVRQLKQWTRGPLTNTDVCRVEGLALLRRPDATLSDLLLVHNVMSLAPQEERAEVHAALAERMRAAETTKEELLDLAQSWSWSESTRIVAQALVDREDMSAEDLIRYMDHPKFGSHKKIFYEGLKRRTAELRTLAERAE